MFVMIVFFIIAIVNLIIVHRYYYRISRIIYSDIDGFCLLILNYLFMHRMIWDKQISPKKIKCNSRIAWWSIFILFSSGLFVTAWERNFC